MKLLFKRDVFLVMITAFIMYWIISLIPFSISKINPYNNVIKDFELTDICFSKFHKSKTAGFDPRIVIVDIGHVDRGQMAEMIKEIVTFKPRVIGIDVLYEGAAGSFADSTLKEQLGKENNIILGSQLKLTGGKFEEQPGVFASKDSLHGFVNLVGEDIGTIRYFTPKESSAEKTFYNFSTLIAKAYDSTSFKRLINRNNNTELINYRRKENEFLIVNYEDLLTGKVNGDFFRDKIVLMGYINSGPFDFEDMKFTPFNEKYAGKSLPDMNGVLIHANTITTILDKAYINSINPWLNWLIILLVSWLHVCFFVNISLRNGGPLQHVFVKTIQFITIILLIYANIILFDRYDLRIDTATLLVILAIDVDIIIFYRALVKWLHKKFGFKTIYQVKKG